VIGTPVGYLGQVTLRWEQCDMMTESRNSELKVAATKQ
jgi:hypothetical protein